MCSMEDTKLPAQFLEQFSITARQREVITLLLQGKSWSAVILLAVPILTGLAVLTDISLGGSGAQLEAAARFLREPSAILSFAIFMLFFGPVPEELGWRGYALDRPQVRWNVLTSNLALGLIWAMWRLPLFFITGTYQNNLSFSLLFFWMYMIVIIPHAILYTWVYNNNRRSTLSAVLFHFTVNFVGQLFKLSERAEIYLFLLKKNTKKKSL